LLHKKGQQRWIFWKIFSFGAVKTQKSSSVLLNRGALYDGGFTEFAALAAKKILLSLRSVRAQRVREASCKNSVKIEGL